MGVNEDDDRLREREEAARRELFAVLAHELRSPIGAILGFEELLSEGIMGELPPATDDALARIRGSARQLLDLVSGLTDLAGDDRDPPALASEAVDAEALVGTVLHALQPEAAGRGAAIHRATDGRLPTITTDPERARRAVQLALMAAIKTTAGGTLTLHTSAGPDELTFRITGSRLHAERDDPDRSLHAADHAHLTGAGLRIGMARTAAASLGGALHMQPDGESSSIVLTLPRTLQP